MTLPSQYNPENLQTTPHMGIKKEKRKKEKGKKSYWGLTFCISALILLLTRLARAVPSETKSGKEDVAM